MMITLEYTIPSPVATFMSEGERVPSHSTATGSIDNVSGDEYGFVGSYIASCLSGWNGIARGSMFPP
jgi:hypothetical protein